MVVPWDWQCLLTSAMETGKFDQPLQSMVHRFRECSTALLDIRRPEVVQGMKGWPRLHHGASETCCFHMYLCQHVAL